MSDLIAGNPSVLTGLLDGYLQAKASCLSAYPHDVTPGVERHVPSTFVLSPAVLRVIVRAPLIPRRRVIFLFISLRRGM
ncbi:MAG: hypothetical protein ABSG77_16830 [Candidatus Acidiferrum sp.]